MLTNEKQRADYIDSCADCAEFLREKVPCKQFITLGRCNLGAKCQFWHDPEAAEAKAHRQEASRLRDQGQKTPDATAPTVGDK
eukprot:gene17461-48458_t